MRLERFKERDNKRIGIVVFTIVCILLVSGVILYRTFAIFEINNNFNVINGSVEDPGDIYFAFYKDEQIQKEMPKKEDGYVLDESQSYCGVTGGNDSNIKVFVTEDNMIHVSGVATSRTKCNLYFVRGAYILGKGIPIVESGEGLYEVKHDDVTEINEGFKTTEYRYAGKDPNNYIKFNDEEWRIIGLVNVMTDENNVEQRVKIVKDTPLEDKKQWDSSNSNDWTKATLNTYLNGEYYNKLTSNAQNMIDEEVIWNIGKSDKININVFEFYKKEREETNQPSKWKKEEKNNFHSIGLMYPSDFWFATSGENLGREKCFEYTLYEGNNHPGWDQDSNGAICSNNDWLKPSNSNILWTLTTNTSNTVYVIDSGHIGNNYPNTSTYYVLPTLYLQNNVKIISGTGILNDMYKLVQILK